MVVMKVRNAVFISLLVVAIIFVSACSFSNPKGVDHLTEASLKVLYYSEDSFQFEYGMLLAALYPNLEIRVIGTNSIYWDQDPEEEFDYDTALFKLIEREKPDLMLLQPEQYTKLAKDNKLYNLDTAVKQSNFDLDGIAPTLLEYLREAGNGQLYGLANSFNSRALFYNKDLFDQYQIPYPTDDMSWEELFHLAMRFPMDGEEDERIYGLKISESRNLFELASWIGYTEELSLVDSSTKQVTLQSELWVKVFQQALDMIQSGNLYADNGLAGSVIRGGNAGGTGELIKFVELVEVEDRNPFIAGRVAMSLEYSSMIQMIKQAKERSRNDEAVIQNWDIVTVPVGEQMADRNPYMAMRQIFAIAADSPNKEAAWEVLSYITGDNYAKAKSKANLSGLSARTAYLNDGEGRNYEAFYRLKPSSLQLLYGDPDMLPKDFAEQFAADARKELERVTNQEVALEDALAELEHKANLALLAE